LKSRTRPKSTGARAGVLLGLFSTEGPRPRPKISHSDLDIFQLVFDTFLSVLDHWLRTWTATPALACIYKKENLPSHTQTNKTFVSESHVKKSSVIQSSACIFNVCTEHSAETAFCTVLWGGEGALTSTHTYTCMAHACAHEDTNGSAHLFVLGAYAPTHSPQAPALSSGVP
jgi:hypothetical protein